MQKSTKPQQVCILCESTCSKGHRSPLGNCCTHQGDNAHGPAHNELLSLKLFMISGVNAKCGKITFIFFIALHFSITVRKALSSSFPCTVNGVCDFQVGCLLFQPLSSCFLPSHSLCDCFTSPLSSLFDRCSAQGKRPVEKLVGGLLLWGQK